MDEFALLACAVLSEQRVRDLRRSLYVFQGGKGGATIFDSTAVSFATPRTALTSSIDNPIFYQSYYLSYYR